MRKLFSIIIVILISVSSAVCDVMLDRVEGAVEYGRLPAGQRITFYIRLNNTLGQTVVGSVNSFELYSTDGATWSPRIWVDTVVECLPPFPCATLFDTTWYSKWWVEPVNLPLVWYSGAGGNQIYDYILDPMVRSDHDSDPQTPSLLGHGHDSIGFFGAVADPLNAVGIPSGFDEIAWAVSLDSISFASVGHSICIDSTSFSFAGGTWLWAIESGSIVPGWGGPYCFEVVADCCEGTRGNINLDLQGEIDISDLTALVGLLFRDQGPPRCFLEADVNADSANDILDLITLVDYMFRSGPAPAACP